MVLLHRRSLRLLATETSDEEMYEEWLLEHGHKGSIDLFTAA